MVTLNTQADVSTASGFSTYATQSAACFRVLLDVMANPGRITEVREIEGLTPPTPLGAPLAAAALTLFDQDTPVWLDAVVDRDGVRDFLAFHCGCPIVADRGACAFAIIASPGDLTSLDGFAIGTPDYPDRSATLLAQVDDLSAESGIVLTGPGIETRASLDAAPLDTGFWTLVQKNNERFPLGLDFVFASADAIAAVPRSTRITISRAG